MGENKLLVPELKITKNIRKFERHNQNKRVEVVYDYLFNGHSHRWLDKHILGQDSSYTRGWNSMAILHHLGIVDVHKGIFKEHTVGQAIEVLTQQNDEMFEPIIEMLRERNNEYSSIEVVTEHPLQYGTRTMEEVERELEEETKTSRGLTKRERSKRLKQALKIPRILTVTTTTYQRNADVVAEVLERASGICERCGAPAPFIRAADGTPYLEVHHKKRLADGGEDTVENAIAVCPNCHRELHFGINEIGEGSLE